MHERALGTGKSLELPARGQVTVIDFWAISCRPCETLMPRMSALARELSGQQVMFIGVAHESNAVETLAAAKMRGADYPQVLDDDGRLDRAWQVRGTLPTTFVVNRRGSIRHVRRGTTASIDDEVLSIRAAVSVC